MFRSLRSSLARFAVRRAAACQRFAPRRADFWLRLACRFTPVLAEAYPALVRLRRAIENRWGALAVAQAGTERFPDNPDAWMLLGEAYQMVYRQKDALAAYEQALALEERPDAAVAAGDLYRRAGFHQEAAARKRCGSTPRRCSSRATIAPRTRPSTCGRRRCRAASRSCPTRAPSCARGSGGARVSRSADTATRHMPTG